LLTLSAPPLIPEELDPPDASGVEPSGWSWSMLLELLSGVTGWSTLLDEPVCGVAGSLEYEPWLVMPGSCWTAAGAF
jgi:hypothetical protein